MKNKIRTDYHPELHLVENKRIGCLLIHGWTSNPAQLGNLAAFLQKKGIWVRTPMMPGHGKTPVELNMIKHEDWIKAAEQELNEFKNYVDYLFVGGWSMGGNIAFHLTSRYDREIEGVLSLATPIYIRREKFIKALLPLIKRLKPIIKKRNIPFLYPWENGGTSYGEIPLSNLNELIKLIDGTKDVIGGLTTNVLLVYSEGDKWVRKGSLEFLAKNLGACSTKKIVLLKKAPHDIILGEERSEVYQEVFDFIVTQVSRKTATKHTV